MNFPQAQPHNDSTPYGTPLTMPTPESDMFTPFAYFAPQPGQSAYPPPISHSTSYQPSYLAPTPAYATHNGPAYSTNNGSLAPPSMGPHPQTTGSTYVGSPYTSNHDVSRPGTSYSAMSGTAVASEQSHGVGGDYHQSRAPTVPPQVADFTKPQTTTGPQAADGDDSHGSSPGCCCVIM